MIKCSRKRVFKIQKNFHNIFSSTRSVEDLTRYVFCRLNSFLLAQDAITRAFWLQIRICDDSSTKISEFPVHERSQLQFYEIRVNKKFCKGMEQHLILQTYLPRIFFRLSDLRWYLYFLRVRSLFSEHL